MYEYGHWHGMYWHMGVLYNIVLLLLLLFAIVLLVQFCMKSPTEGHQKQNSAMDTLKKRYAAGEIDAAEFSQKKRDLES